MPYLTAQALSQFWLAEWHTLREKPIISLKEWIRQNKFQINNPPLSDSIFTLNYTRDNNPLSCIAYDCNKFSSSVIETVNGLSFTSPGAMKNTTAWLAIQSYYASFYAVHFLLRIFGKSCTQLESHEANTINQMLGVFHPGCDKIVGGYYVIEIDPSGQTLIFKKVIGRRPHHLLWFEFTTFLNRIVEELKKGSQRYQPVMLKLQSLENNLRHNSQKDGTWLSTIREEVNYKHSYSAWFPYVGVKDARIGHVIRLLSKIPSDSLTINIEDPQKDELIKFFNNTVYLVALCCEVIGYMKDNTSIKTFHEYGPLKLLSLLEG